MDDTKHLIQAVDFLEEHGGDLLPALTGLFATVEELTVRKEQLASFLLATLGPPWELHRQIPS